MAACVSEYTLEFFTLLNAKGKKELIEWCIKETRGFIALNYECPKYNERMGLYERNSAVLDGFEWRCQTLMFDHSLAEYGTNLISGIVAPSAAWRDKIAPSSVCCS
ncbi:uncharacterized protein TNCV_4683431 [Trichonephila clavipes]|nr:uncharacterized protein TNCV_4683431 [Trichonephila clavipes]